jgi:hypothetical protein
MAKLTAGKRKALPKADFAGPGRSFPVPDANHARLAKSAASRKVNSGTMSTGEAGKIDAKANKVLHDGKTSPVKSDRGTFHMKENKPAPAKGRVRLGGMRSPL